MEVSIEQVGAQFGSVVDSGESVELSPELNAPLSDEWEDCRN